MRNKVDDLFHRLADLSPDERASVLAADPPGAHTLREVEDLLAYDTAGDDQLEPSILAAAVNAVQRIEPVGARCGPFRLVSIIGRGGMGVVYLAERADGEIRQHAAIKLLHPGWTEVHRDRFLHEREILAALSHPNIAHLLDAGHLEDGQPYLAMEYVVGRPIDQYCQDLSARQKIQLFLKVCAAVDYLHRNHLVHRDLKPGNILVTAEGEPKLLDFGISKMLDLASDVTATSLRMLTPHYASPEQMSGAPISSASDIYSLGVMLRELLSGSLNADLAAIVGTATRPEPGERYRSAEQLALDLHAVLDSKPVRARRGNWIYRVKKFAARRPFAIAAVASLAVTVLAAAGIVRPHPVSTPAVNARRLTANTHELPIYAAALSPDGKSMAYSDALGIHIRDTASGATRLLPATERHVIAHWMPDSARLVAKVQVGTSLTTVIVPLSGAPPSTVSEPWHYSPNGKRRIVSPAGIQRVVAENADGSDSREIWRTSEKRVLNDFTWSPNSQEVAIISSVDNASILEIVDVVRQRKFTPITAAHKLFIGGIVFTSPDRIVLSTYERTGAASYNSNLWEARLNHRRELAPAGLRPLTSWTDFPIQPGSLTTDGKHIVFVRNFAQRDVYVAGVDPARPRMETPRRLTLDLSDDYPTGWTLDGKSVILASDRSGEFKIYRQSLDGAVAEPVADFPGKQILPRLTPDGKSVLFCSMLPKDTTCRLMRAPLEGGKPQFVDNIPQIGDFRCSPAGPCVVDQLRTQPALHTVSELDPVKGKGREIYRHTDNFSGTPDISRDGKFLATVSRTSITVRSYRTGATVREIKVRDVNQIFTLDYAPDGKGFYAGEFRPTESRQLYVDLSGKTTLLWRQQGRSIIWGVPSNDGRNLAMLMYTSDANVYMVDAF